MRAVAAIAATLALGGCADPYAPAVRQHRPPQRYGRDAGPLITPGAQDAANAGDQREVRRNARRPAFADLPYLAGGIAVDYVDERSGRLVLLVVYAGSRTRARAAYRRFLARYGDSGRAYIPVFRPARKP